MLTTKTVKEIEIDNVFVTYTECPACGYKTLRQLDNLDTRAICEKMLKLMKQERLNARRNRQSSIKDKTSMKTLNKRLIIKRKKLNDMYWDKLQDKINEDANQEA